MLNSFFSQYALEGFKAEAAQMKQKPAALKQPARQ